MRNIWRYIGIFILVSGPMIIYSIFNIQDGIVLFIAYFITTFIGMLILELSQE